MLRSHFRQDIDWISVKFGILFSKIGLSPNTWTLLALAPAAIGLYFIYEKMLLEAVIFFIFAGFLDVIDGAVARVTGSDTNFGAFLDGVVDRYVEILLYIGLWRYLMDVYTPIFSIEVWILLLVFGALMPSFVRAYADHRKVVTEEEELHRMGGFLERAERLGLLYFGMILGVKNIDFLVYSVYIVAVLSNLTTIQRIFYAFKHKEKH